MLAFALQDVCVAYRRADVGMAVADTATTNTDLLDGVVVSSGDCVVSLGHRHEMPQHSLSLHQADPDVRGC